MIKRHNKKRHKCKLKSKTSSLPVRIFALKISKGKPGYSWLQLTKYHNFTEGLKIKLTSENPTQI